VNPSVFDTRVVNAVAAAAREAAIEEDIARRTSLVQEDDSTLAAVK
jgi:malic enzyme